MTPRAERGRRISPTASRQCWPAVACSTGTRGGRLVSTLTGSGTRPRPALIRWDGAQQPTIWMVQAPEMDARAARLELARRYLHIYGPTTPEAFGRWAGIGRRRGGEAFSSLRASLTPVRTPIADGWILEQDEAACRAATGPPAPARLLPSGDAYLLLQGDDRALLVPDADRRQELWTPRVWPGGLLVRGEVVGTWRRADAVVTVRTWRSLSSAERDAVESEAGALPLPGIAGRMAVRWEGASRDG